MNLSYIPNVCQNFHHGDFLISWFMPVLKNLKKGQNAKLSFSAISAISTIGVDHLTSRNRIPKKAKLLFHRIWGCISHGTGCTWAKQSLPAAPTLIINPMACTCTSVAFFITNHTCSYSFKVCLVISAQHLFQNPRIRMFEWISGKICRAKFTLTYWVK